jgi:hypothetical protein
MKVAAAIPDRVITDMAQHGDGQRPGFLVGEHHAQSTMPDAWLKDNIG